MTSCCGWPAPRRRGGSDEARARGTDAPIVSVNLSAEELAADDLVERVGEILDDVGLDPRSLCLEVTEGAVAFDINGSARRLASLRELGVRVAIDDFGTGYSSLSYVHRCPLDVLKIDRSFVVEMEHSERARQLVQGIVVLCRELGITAVVEGVENPAQLAIVAMDCRWVQGLLLARAENRRADRCPPARGRGPDRWPRGRRRALLTDRRGPTGPGCPVRP